jgi:hypothetical protein
MVKNDEELNSLGQLIVSITKEILDTNRKVLDLEKRVSEQEKRTLDVEANHNIQELEENYRTRKETTRTSRGQDLKRKHCSESEVIPHCRLPLRMLCICTYETTLYETFRFSQIARIV